MIVSGFFRMLAALVSDESIATTIAGLAVLDFVVYTGYARFDIQPGLLLTRVPYYSVTLFLVRAW